MITGFKGGAMPFREILGECTCLSQLTGIVLVAYEEERHSARFFALLRLHALAGGPI